MELTNYQISKAKEWHMAHSEHCLKLFYEAEKDNVCYPPSEEDANHPNLWKPAHWSWFYMHYLFNI